MWQTKFILISKEYMSVKLVLGIQILDKVEKYKYLSTVLSPIVDYS